MSTHTNERTNDGMVPQWISHPSADTPDESQLGEHPDLNDRMEAGFARLRETAANSLVRMDAAESAAEALSKWAHLLPTYATEAREAAASWRLARSL